MGARMDEDLDKMPHEELIEETKKLRKAIREHRDSTLHDLCWYQPELWNLLPEKTDPEPTVPRWPEFMQGCIKFRQSLDEQAESAPRTDQHYGK